MMILPKPGDVVLHDFRIAAAAPSGKPEIGASVSLVQWNIERGYKLNDIIAELRVLDADVISLQVRRNACHLQHSTCLRSTHLSMLPPYMFDICDDYLYQHKTIF